MRKLNAAQCKSISKPGFYRCADTLYLYIKPTGRKSWVQRITIDGKRRNLGLGPYPVVTLAKARLRAIDNQRKVEDNTNPLLEKRRAQMPTFEEAATKTYEALKPTWKSHQTEASWLRSLQIHATPIIGDSTVDRITENDVIEILTPIWTTKPEAARRVKRRIRAVLDWCKERGYIQQNVADSQFRTNLPPMPKQKENYPALPYREVPDAIRRIDIGVTTMSARLCILFLIYTAARPVEAMRATWSEIDFEETTWTISKQRMKAGRDHRVALSTGALAVLEQAKSLRDNSGLLFPSQQNQGKPLSSEFWQKHFKKLGLSGRTVLHGFRASFKSWASECTDIPREVIEMALSHKVGDAVEQAYQRSDLLKKRKRLMQLWDDYLSE